MGDHGIRIKALEQARKELEDSFLVMTHLETNRETDRRIADLVSAVGALIGKIPSATPKQP